MFGLPIEAITSLGGLIIPPLFKLVAGIFGKTANAQSTLSQLAIDKPEVMPQYLASLAQLFDAQTKFFNRDVTGTPSQWVVNLRSAIRPLTVAISIIAIVLDVAIHLNMDAPTRAALSANITSWIGDKIQL